MAVERSEHACAVEWQLNSCKIDVQGAKDRTVKAWRCSQAMHSVHSHQRCPPCARVPSHAPGGAAAQMLIKGIRSFSPDNTTCIEFYKPLTLIVGANGAGKTVRARRFRVWGFWMRGVVGEVEVEWWRGERGMSCMVGNCPPPGTHQRPLHGETLLGAATGKWCWLLVWARDDGC
eukprot:355181-Chlamydomonas_euryale.AAC.5